MSSGRSERRACEVDIRMRALLALLLICLASSCVIGGKNAVNVYGGERTSSGNFFEAEDAPVFGVEGLLGITTDGLGVEGGYAWSGESSTASDGVHELETNELYVGMRHTWSPERVVQPYVAVGLDWLDGEAKYPTGDDDSGNGLGVYGRAGVGFQVGIFQAGFDLRGAVTMAEIQCQDLNFVQGAVFVGLSF